MQLIPLNQTIYFNATDMSLLYVYLLAFAYHPLYSNILYLLYGQKNATLGSYHSMHLLTRDTDTSTFLQNETLNIDFHCAIDCEVKATPSFFLIESQNVIGIYTIAQNTRKVETSAHYYLMDKTSANNGANIITRFADIHADKFIIMDPRNSTLLLGNVTQRIPLSFPFTFDGDSVLYVGMYESRIVVAMDKTRLKFYFYQCLTCANNTPIVVQTATFISVLQGFRIYRGYPLLNSSLVDGVVYWGFNSGSTSPVILANDTSFWVLNYLLSLGVYSTGNRENLLLFGLDSIIYHHKFVPDDMNGAYNYGTPVRKMAIANDSTVVAIKQRYASWEVVQYQFVTNCSYYAAIPRSNLFICDCQMYSSNRQCAVAGAGPANSTNTTNATVVVNNQMNTTTNISRPIVNPVINTTTGNQTDIGNASAEGSFPIGAVIGVIAGLVVITFSIIMVKKNYQRCLKERRRTPWKYNPVELMSFEA